MHDSLIDRVIAAPVNLFFDVTPIGKLLNRFSSDLKTLQWGIMHNIWDFVMVLQSVIVSFGVAVFVMDKIVVIEAIFFIIAFQLFLQALPAYKECSRIGMT